MAAVFLTNHSSSETKAVPHWFWHSVEIGSTTCASGISFASLYWSLGILLKLPFNVTPWMVVFSMLSSSTIFLLFYLLNISFLPLLHLTIFISRMDNDSVVSNCYFCNPHILFVGCLGRLKKLDGSDQRKLSWKKDWKFYRKEGTWGKGVRRDSLRFEKI